MLNLDGFEFIRFFRRSRRYAWRDSTGFAAWTFKNNEIVVFDCPVPDNIAVRGLAKFNRELSGHVGGLPDTYGLTAGDLAELMTRWRERAIANKT